MSTDFIGKAFRIVSARDADDNVRCALVFRGSAHQHSLELPDTAFPWSPDWWVSPDTRWLLRVQKTGSGANCGILYTIGPGQQVTRQKMLITDLVFKMWQRERKPPCNNLFHDRMTFQHWERQGFRFTWRASHWPWCEKKHAPLNKDQKEGIELRCFYDLRTHQVSIR